MSYIAVVPLILPGWPHCSFLHPAHEHLKFSLFQKSVCRTSHFRSKLVMRKLNFTRQLDVETEGFPYAYP